MRVLLFGPYPEDMSRPSGGVESSFVNLVGGLATFPDLDLRVVTFVRGAAGAREARDGRVPVTYLPGTTRFNNLTVYRSDRRAFAAAREAFSPDVVHAQDAIGYGFVALKAAARTPVAVTIHGIVEQELPHYAKRSDRLRTRLARIPVQRYTIRRAEMLLQPSSYPGEYFGPLVRGSVETIGNPIAPRFFSTRSQPEEGRVLFVGNVSSLKRVHDAIAVLHEVRCALPQARLRIVGPLESPAYGDELRGLVDRAGLGDAVSFAGPLGPAELADEYAAAEVLLLPSAQENSPMVIGEAMAGGVPVVATRVGGVATLVEHGETGFLAEVGDVAALSRHVRTVLESPAVRGRMRARACQVAAERFRPEAVAARVRDVYLRLGAPTHLAIDRPGARLQETVR